MPKTAIIFVHGFMGCHRQFEQLADFIDDGETEMVFHVLPGHESSLADFKQSNAALWQQSVTDIVRKMSLEYDRILLVGHSMGGLLCEGAAIAAPEKVVGVAAIGYPIKISIGPRWFSLMSAASNPYVEGEDPIVTAARENAGVTIKTTGEYLSTLPQNLQFLKTTRIARRQLSELKAPLKVLNFARDEIVAKSTPKFVKSRKPDAEVIVYPESHHFYFEETELVKMADEIRKML